MRCRSKSLSPGSGRLRPTASQGCASLAERSAYGITSDQEEPNEHDQANVQVFKQAIATLQEQLKVANSRAERFFDEEPHLLEAERLCSAELGAALIDAVAAERIAAGEAAALRAEANHRHAWRLLRPYEDGDVRKGTGLSRCSSG
jgi:hypothetical protein